MSYERNKKKVVVSVKWETWVEIEGDSSMSDKEIQELATIQWQDRNFIDDFDLEFDIV